jgi:5-methylcytosine-specific restriction protein A
MPTRLCAEPRCPNPATYRGRCPTHSQQRERQTHPNKALYSSKRWQLTRRRVLFDHPICACGCGEVASDVDHIVPVEQGGDRWARSNLQPLAHECHARKTRQEQATQ